jgi:GrpB-like predicted nucleotidyltransferase (UPF0157 family)
VTESNRHPSLDERFDRAITIVDYDPEWPREFNREGQAVRRALGNLAVRVEHVGSTAVPGLPAKPIIDIQVAVSKIEPREAYVRPLERLGYLFAPDPDSPDYHFFGKPARRPRRFHVHVAEAGSFHEQRHLAVRDYLRADAAAAERYSALKRELLTRHRGDRLAYMERKEQFMEELERRALEWWENEHGSDTT